MPLNTPIPKIMITAGEPAGIGPDVVLMLAQHDFPAQLIIIANRALLAQRAEQLGLTVRLRAYDASANAPRERHRRGGLWLIDQKLAAEVSPGQADSANAGYVLEGVRTAARACLAGECAAMVTGPVSKSVIAAAGFAFSGHTECIAALCNQQLGKERGGEVYQPVMLLVNDFCRVALATTHLPLCEVAAAITAERLKATIRALHRGLQARFDITRPRILVCGLNPHAGEQGCLGREESAIIEPVIGQLNREGHALYGPLPADTAFTPAALQDADAVLAMYHDQGLPVIKSHGFGATVNITLGLPIIRTSVDHGTAFALAGSGRADPQSLVAAVRMAIELAGKRTGQPV